MAAFGEVISSTSSSGRDLPCDGVGEVVVGGGDEERGEASRIDVVGEEVEVCEEVWLELCDSGTFDFEDVDGIRCSDPIDGEDTGDAC